ncbi:MAG: SAP domain-containing protein [Candidatus Thioglobus sp.]|nr:SAP domain-containing protein [Candidatus Thioglobus sp.]
MSIADLDQFKVKQLKDFLRSRGELVAGSKSELLQRAKGVLLLMKQPLSDIKHRDENLDNQSQ